MIEEELRARANGEDQNGVPSVPVGLYDPEIIIIEEAEVVSESEHPDAAFEVKEEVAVKKRDPRRDDENVDDLFDEPSPVTPRVPDPLSATTAPPPPNYAPELDWDPDE